MEAHHFKKPLAPRHEVKVYREIDDAMSQYDQEDGYAFDGVDLIVMLFHVSP